MSVLPLAVVHTLGNLLTNVSLGQVAVSFTHTIKVCKICAYTVKRAEGPQNSVWDLEFPALE